MSSFLHSVYLPQKFGVDMRNNTLSALVRNGQSSREDAWAEYNTPPIIEEELVSYVQKRLEVSKEQYARIIATEPRSWWEFPTYKKRFERLRPLFRFLASKNLVPTSFYLKYCFSSKR